jgi:DnaA family protein
MRAQLALDLRLRDGSSFDNFYPAQNEEVLRRMRDFLDAAPESGPTAFFVWGESASGKSHLLQSACRLVHGRQQLPLYVPFSEPGLPPILLDEADEATLICLDDLERIADNVAWESALFRLYELARATGTKLLASGNAPPTRLGLKMPELASRLAWGPVYQLSPLSDGEKLEAMQLRAHNRGFEVAPEVASYILRRYPRDLSSLFNLLERIDVASLASQRRVTIPFLRELERSHDAT